MPWGRNLKQHTINHWEALDYGETASSMEHWSIQKVNGVSPRIREWLCSVATTLSSWVILVTSKVSNISPDGTDGNSSLAEIPFHHFWWLNKYGHTISTLHTYVHPFRRFAWLIPNKICICKFYVQDTRIGKIRYSKATPKFRWGATARRDPGSKIKFDIKARESRTWWCYRIGRNQAIDTITTCS